MRLINADALHELIDGGYDLNFDEVPETKRELLKMVDNQETIDAVPVVRCKDCKYRAGRACDYSAVWVRADGFCNWGERIEYV